MITNDTAIDIINDEINNVFSEKDIEFIKIGDIICTLNTVDLYSSSIFIPCEGQKLLINEYSELFDVIGYKYNTIVDKFYFTIPDLTNRYVRATNLNEKCGVLTSNDIQSFGMESNATFVRLLSLASVGDNFKSSNGITDKTYSVATNITKSVYIDNTKTRTSEIGNKVPDISVKFLMRAR